MMSNSFFHESFWHKIPEFFSDSYIPEDAKQFNLTSKNKPITLFHFEGQLVKTKNNIPIKALHLIEVQITLDEEGLTLRNTQGMLNLNGPKLQQLHELINPLCMHTNLTNYYKFLQNQYEFPHFKIDCYQSLQTGIKHSLKIYQKTYSKEKLRNEIQCLQGKLKEVYEDATNVYVIMPYLSGTILSNKELPSIECVFGVLKMLHQYHKNNLIVQNVNEHNILVLDDNYNMDLMDTTNLQVETFSFDNLDLYTSKSDVKEAGLMLLKMYPNQEDLLKPLLQGQTSALEILFGEKFVTHFGDSKFFKFLNAEPYQKDNHFQVPAIEAFLINQQTQIQTFNTIKASMMDSDDDSIDEEQNLANPYTNWVQEFRKTKYNTANSDDSPILSPKITQEIKQELPVPTHKSKLSSRQVVLDTLLNENIINQMQYKQLYNDNEFQDEEDIYQFSSILQKEIQNSSSFTTPIQSENTTCPNTVKINQTSKEAMMRISDLLTEASEEIKLRNIDQPYNVNKVQNVRKHLYNLH